MPGIKRQLLFGRNFDFAGKHALGKRAARVIPENLNDAAKLVDETSDASVRGANHWPTHFYGAKYCIRQVLMRSSGALKPSIVGHIYEHVRTGTCVRWKNKLSGQFANRVFETDQRRHMGVAIGQSEHSVFASFFKIAGYLIANNPRKQRHSMPAGNIFAKWQQMDFPIDLNAVAAIGDKNRRVINILFVDVDCSQQKIRLRRRDQIHHEFMTLLICQNWPWHRALRPNQQIRWGI